METFVEATNYAPQKGESGEEYAARLYTIKDAPSSVLQAARIIASAMKQSIYDPKLADADMDKIQKGLKHIVIALEGFSTSNKLANARSDLMDFALSQFEEMTGKKVSPDTAKKLITGKNVASLEAKLVTAVSNAWNGMKEGAGLKPDANNRDVIKSFKDNVDGKLVDTDLSLLAQEVLALREKFRASKKQK